MTSLDRVSHLVMNIESITIRQFILIQVYIYRSTVESFPNRFQLVSVSVMGQPDGTMAVSDVVDHISSRNLRGTYRRLYFFETYL